MYTRCILLAKRSTFLTFASARASMSELAVGKLDGVQHFFGFDN